MAILAYWRIEDMKIYAILFFFSACLATPNYFDTSFLIQYEAVKASLKNDGFQEVFFTTQDNLKINALLYIHAHARANIICFAGWYPGRKETLAPFFTMFGDNYNILLVDARGHGISEGPLFSNAWQYGLHDYFDHLGALQFMHKISHKPSFIIGLCAGAFNAAHAAIKLGDKGQELGLRGIVFDSGWASVYDTSYTAINATLTDNLAKTIGWAYGIRPIDAKKTYVWNICATISSVSLYAIHTVLFKPFHAYYDSTMNLNNSIAQCPVPIFFIHAHDDVHASITCVQKLAEKVLQKNTWWIEQPSKHAGHHFKHTKDYQKKVAQFFDSLLDH